MAWLLLALLPQDRVVAGREDAPVLRASLSGGLELRGAFRDRALQETRSALNGTTGGSTEGVVLGYAGLRLDIELDEHLSGAVGVGAWSSDDDADLPLGSNPENTQLFLVQGYVEVSGLLSPDLHLRAGVQDFGFRLRPQGEPFFLDVGESEPFYAGAGAFVRNTADRNVLTPAGVNLRWAIADFAGAEFFWAHTRDAGVGIGDENLFGALLNGLFSERISWFFFGGLVTGGERGRVATVGIGVDLYASKSRWLEIFGEIYLQWGRLTDGVDKLAWAMEAGARAYGSRFWVEAGYAFRSGDRDPSDGTDGSFQSYENANRFAIAESAALGLDIDTNVWSPRLAAAWRPRERLEVRIDVAEFRFDHYVRDASGARLSNRTRLGTEVDGRIAWELPSGVIALRAALLAGSEFADSVAGSRTIWLVCPEVSVDF